MKSMLSSDWMSLPRLSPEEFAERVTDILDDVLSKLPPEEYDRRLNKFEATVKRVCSRIRVRGEPAAHN